MRYINLLIILFLPLFTYSQSEKWLIQGNIQTIGYIGASVQKDFHESNFTFGPRVELLSDANNIGGLLNIYLVSIWYKVSTDIEIGVSPFWMRGPLPRSGIYSTPSSIHGRWRKDDKSIELWLTTSKQQPINIRFAHDLNFQ